MWGHCGIGLWFVGRTVRAAVTLPTTPLRSLTTETPATEPPTKPSHSHPSSPPGFGCGTSAVALPFPGLRGLTREGFATRGPARERLLGRRVPGTGSALAPLLWRPRAKRACRNTTARARGGVGTLALRWNHHAQTHGESGNRVGLKGAARLAGGAGQLSISRRSREITRPGPGEAGTGPERAKSS